MQEERWGWGQGIVCEQRLIRASCSSALFMKVFRTAMCGRWGRGGCCEREKGGKATSVSDNYSPEGVRNVGILR